MPGIKVERRTTRSVYWSVAGKPGIAHLYVKKGHKFNLSVVIRLYLLATMGRRISMEYDALITSNSASTAWKFISESNLLNIQQKSVNAPSVGNKAYRNISTKSTEFKR